MLALASCENGDKSFNTYEVAGEGSSALGTCAAFCRKLSECETIPRADELDCVLHCSELHAQDPDLITSGCECVIEDECRTPQTSDCSEAPWPDTSTGGSGGSSGSGGSAGSGGTGNSGGSCGSSGIGGSSAAGGSSAVGGSGGVAGAEPQNDAGDPGEGCTSNLDCSREADCVDGQCKVRCYASCDCAMGLACENGHCR